MCPLRVLMPLPVRRFGAQDDSAASECRLCGKRFGTMRRRHHCRKCGQLVCHGCSLHRKHVDGSDHPKRVCDICAVVESERHSARDDAPAPE